MDWARVGIGQGLRARARCEQREQHRGRRAPRPPKADRIAFHAGTLAEGVRWRALRESNPRYRRERAFQSFIAVRHSPQHGGDSMPRKVRDRGLELREARSQQSSPIWNSDALKHLAQA